MDHKRQVSKAVSDMHSKPQGSYSKNLDTEVGKRPFASCQPVLSTVGPTEMANPALREHTQFMSEPHPLVVAKNERQRATVYETRKSLAKSRRHRVEQKENSSGQVGKVNQLKDTAAASTNGVGLCRSDEDQEYYTELEDNVHGRRTAQILVRLDPLSVGHSINICV